MFFDISNLQPLTVGDFSTISAWENDQQAKVEQMVCHFSSGIVYRDLVTQYMINHGIDYPNLPQYLINKIDTINVY